MELGGGQDHRVDLPADARLRFMQGPDRLGEANFTHQQDVHIAARSLVPTRHRTEHQCQREAFAQGGQGFRQHIGESCRLAQNAGQFRIDRAQPIGAVKNLVANLLACQHASLGEPCQFLVQGAGTGAGQAGDFADVIALFRVQQQAGEDFLAVIAKEK